jgi:hypothetical protein
LLCALHTLKDKIGALGGVSKMKTAAEYRALAEECFQWARETHDRAVRAGYLGLAQVWLDAAAKLDGLPAKRLAPAGKAHPDAPATEQRKDLK